MLSRLSLFSEPGSHLLTFRLRFRPGNQIVEPVPFFLRIKVHLPARIVVRDQPLWNPAILLASDVTGRQMEQSGAIRMAHEVKNIQRCVRVRSQCIPQIRIEVSQAGTVDDDVQILLKILSDPCRQSETRLGYVPLDDFDFVAQEIRQPVSVTLE